MPKARTPETVVREISKSFKAARKLIMDGMNKTTVGTVGRLNYIRALSDLERRHRQEMADRGVVPQNLGVAVTKRYVFHATVDAAVMDDRRTAGERLMVEELDREYATLPPPQVAVEGENEQNQPQVQQSTADDFELEEDENEPEEDLQTWP